MRGHAIGRMHFSGWNKGDAVTMVDLRDLTTDAKRLYEALNVLQEKEEKLNAYEVDLEEIWFSAKNRSFENHGITKLDVEEARNYLLLLAGLIALADDAEKRLGQIRFLARVIAGYKNAEINLKDIINGGLLLQKKNLDKLQEIRNHDVIICLLVDMLLMVYLDGNICAEQLDYVVEIIAVLGIRRDEVEAIGNVVKGILKQEDDLIISQSQYLDISNFNCYKKTPIVIVVRDLEKAKKVKTEKIIFRNMEWERLSTINIDEYSAKTVEFSNCTFIGLSGMICKSKKLILSDCSFKDSVLEENMFILANAEISNCEFVNLRTTGSRTKHLIYLLNSQVNDCQFSKITIQHNIFSPYGGVLKSENCVLKNSTFDHIETLSGDHSRYRKVFDFEGGELVDCKFLYCTLSLDSFLLTISESTVKERVVVENLNSNRDKENTDYHSNMSDQSIEQIFGGK
jgi:uncharacterized protein YjbI with pentapeptide repeats